MRKILTVGVAVAPLVGMTIAAAPASAACTQGDLKCGTTTVALTVLDGQLVISTTAVAAGASSSLVGTERVITAPLGLTTVTDTRAGSSGWVLSASTTDFSRTVPSAATIPASAAKFYVQAAPTKVLGTVTYTSTTTPDASGTLVDADATGVNTTEVVPVLQVTVPEAAGTGVYAGTVTQSVV